MGGEGRRRGYNQARKIQKPFCLVSSAFFVVEFCKRTGTGSLH